MAAPKHEAMKHLSSSHFILCSLLTMSSKERPSLEYEPGRYHLLAAYSDPAAHQAILMRRLKGLQVLLPAGPTYSAAHASLHIHCLLHAPASVCTFLHVVKSRRSQGHEFTC